MTVSKTPLMVAAFFFVASCAHNMTGEDHRAAAANDMAAADKEKAKYDPGALQMAVVPPRTSGLSDEPTSAPIFYNPTAAHLDEADRKMDSAFKHLEAARKLEKYEDAACAGISTAVRTSCPLIAPHLEKIEEGSRGIVLHIKTAEQARQLSIQMRCHLAFAQANNFDRSPCPLYFKGVVITLVGDKAIEVTSTDPNVAREVRQEARRMFGEPQNKVSSR